MLFPTVVYKESWLQFIFIINILKKIDSALLKWHALMLADGSSSCLPTVGSVCAFRDQYVYFVTFFPSVQYLQRKIGFNNVILYMASVFILK